MARICPQCAMENADNSTFCAQCGFRLQGTEQAWNAVPEAPNNPSPMPPPAAAPQNPFQQGGYAAQRNTPPNEPRPYVSATGSPNDAPQPNAPFFASPPGSVYGAAPVNDPYRAPGTGYGPLAGQQQQQQQLPFPGAPFPNSSQYPPPQQEMPYAGAPASSAKKINVPNVDLTVVRRAFAGKGTPMTHTSWLLDGKQVSPTDVRSAIVEKVQQHYPGEVKASQEHLSERDAVLEERDYVKIERAPANVFVYVTRFGPDLYVSRTTTVQPALSPVRIAVFALLALCMIIGFILAAASNPSTLDIAGLLSALQFKFTVSLFSYLILFFFIALALRSLLLWLTEKDYLVYLRPNVLNDFRLDDGAILEHVADKGTREAVESLGLDASELAGPSRNYPAKQSLHRF